MKKKITILVILALVSFIQIGCNSNSRSSNDEKNNNAGDSFSIITESKDSDITKTNNITKDTLDDLLKELKKIPPIKGYKVNGELETGVLKYKSMEFGDLLHLIFVDDQKKEYDFNENMTKIELYTEAKNPNEGNQGLEANKKYINKKFRVVWRTLQLKQKPKDETEMNYYEVYDEIIYLKQIK